MRRGGQGGTLTLMRAKSERPMTLPNGATSVEVRFGPHVRVVWPEWTAGKNEWDVWTGKGRGANVVRTFSSFDEAIVYAREYAIAREKH
jgi:hypothetical protein